MTQDQNPLSRWSRRKLEQKKLEQEKAQAELQAKQSVAARQPEQEPAPLPPVESLTPQSDFTGFMQPKVQDSVRRIALKKLFADPHFNIPDAFEPFSGDWTVGEAISPAMLKELNQAYTLLFSDEEKKAHDEEKARLAALEAQAISSTPPAEPTQQPTQEAKQDEPGRQDT